MKQIVIATDGSGSAAPALQAGFALAAQTGADVAVVHVRYTSSTILGTPYSEQAVEDVPPDVEAVMLDAKLHATRYGLDADYEVVGGDPAGAIVDPAGARRRPDRDRLARPGTRRRGHPRQRLEYAGPDRRPAGSRREGAGAVMQPA